MKKKYKVQLKNGDLAEDASLLKIKKWILEGKIDANTSLAVAPYGSWKKAKQDPQVSELLMLHLAGKLKALKVVEEGKSETFTLGKTKTLSEKIEEPLLSKTLPPEKETSEEKTVIVSRPSRVEKTQIVLKPENSKKEMQGEKTTFLELPQEEKEIKQVQKKKKILWKVIAILLVVSGVLSLFIPEEEDVFEVRLFHFVASMPEISNSIRPKQSEILYKKGLRYYVMDSFLGYAKASAFFKKSVFYNPNHVKALALLVSCYIHLIDVSTQNEKYFQIISKLIQMIQAKSVNIPETVLADTEFFLMMKRYRAAQNRIVDYTRGYQKFGLEMYYYLSLVFFHRGAYASAAKYLEQISDDKVFSPRVFYLKGEIAERLGALDEALLAYQKAIRFRTGHISSRLRVIALLVQKGEIQKIKIHLRKLLPKRNQMSMRQVAKLYFYLSKWYALNRNWEDALKSIVVSAKLFPRESKYLLEYYTLQARTGRKVKNVKPIAKMFYFLKKGEEKIKSGENQKALIFFLKARDAYLESAMPLVKIGEAFLVMHDYKNALENFRKAAQMRVGDVLIWAKYIKMLIMNYNWKEAASALAKIKTWKGSRSAFEKLYGDFYASQKRYRESVLYYKRALSREVIDPGVYISYGDVLIKLKEFKKASFFFSIALRLDPFRFEAIEGIARMISETESIDEAIGYLQEEMKKQGTTRADFLSEIASYYFKKGDHQVAEKKAKEAASVDPQDARPWKVLANVYEYRFKTYGDKKALKKALSAYDSYSQRNVSDPEGFLKRFQIFLKESRFEDAAEELNKIYEIFPNYPSLHYYKGYLYVRMGNLKIALQEYQREIKMHPKDIRTILELGKIFLKGHRAKEALKYFNQAMQLSPQNSEVLHLAGYANFLLKNYQGAIALLENAVQLDPGNPVLYKRLGIVYLTLGDRVRASRMFRKYLQIAPNARDRAEFEKYL